MKKVLKIGNAQAFWGDSGDAPAALVKQQPDLDYLTLDYLSEVSLSIMAVQRSKDSTSGYARDFIEVVKSIIPFWKQGSKVKIVTNAGGLQPRECGLACAKILRQSGIPLRIGIVGGDDVLEMIRSNPDNPLFANLESGESISTVVDKLETANAYVGSKPIVEAIKKGADIVITGRIADPSMTVAPCVVHFSWSLDDYDKIAQATVAGHLIECGVQVTGGISTHWLAIDQIADIGFPIVEMSESGDFIVTKPPKTGGEVSLATVKEQLLYEIGDPARYLSPDVTLSMLSLALKQEGKDRVAVRGAKGFPPPANFKVSSTYRDGFKAEGMLTIVGQQAAAKARRCGEIILERVRKLGYNLERSSIECLGTGDVVPGVWKSEESLECLLRICVADKRMEAVECFAKQMAPMVTSGPPGTTGYTSGRPRVRPVFGYWPCLVNVSDVTPQVEIIEV